MLLLVVSLVCSGASVESTSCIPSGHVVGGGCRGSGGQVTVIGVGSFSDKQLSLKESWCWVL